MIKINISPKPKKKAFRYFRVLSTQNFWTASFLSSVSAVQVRLDNRVLKVVENRVVSALSKELLIETLQVSPRAGKESTKRRTSPKKTSSVEKKKKIEMGGRSDEEGKGCGDHSTRGTNACVLFEYFASEVLMFTPPARATPRFCLLNSLSTDY